MQLGEYAKSVDDYEKLLKLNPPFPKILVVCNNLAYVLAAAPDDRVRNGKRAVQLAQRANKLHGTPSPDTLDTLAAAYAEAGQFDRAIETQQQAIALAPDREIFQQRLQLYKSGKPLRADAPEARNTPPEEPNAAAEPSAENGATAPPVEIPIIVAQHVMLHEGKIIEWADVERLVTGLPNPKLAHPSFKFTHGALPIREEEIRAKVWELRTRVEFTGHSWGSLSPRTSARYDAIRTAADLVPNEARRVDGTVQTPDGLPIDGAEVVLLVPVPESLPYKTLDVYLRNERLRNPDDEIVTRSDASGRFAFYPPPDTPYYVVALHREGFGLVRSADFAQAKRVAIQPWARIHGKIKDDARFTQSANLRQRVPAEDGWPELTFYQYSEDLGPPKPSGEFEFAYVAPGLNGMLDRSVQGEQGRSYSLPVKEFLLAPGESLTTDIEPPSDAEVQRVEQLKSSLKKNRDEGEALANADAFDGTVQTTDGVTVGGAEIVLLSDNGNQSLSVFVVHLSNERLRDPADQIVTRSDGAGRFTVYPQPDAPYYLVALHREGFGLVRSDEFSKSRRIVIEPWAQVKGRIENDERITLPAAITISVAAQTKSPEVIFVLQSTERDVPSPDGRFEFAFVPPSLEGWLCRVEKGERGSISVWRHKKLQLAPGEAMTVNIERLSDTEVERIERARRMDTSFLGPARETN
jgi:hypothetical protein